MYSFPMQEQEVIIKKNHANLQKEGEAFHGALYLTNQRLVFVGYVGDLNNKYMHDTPLEHLKELIPAKTFFCLSNVIKVQTINDENYKIIISGRDSWITAITEQCNKIE